MSPVTITEWPEEPAITVDAAEYAQVRFLRRNESPAWRRLQPAGAAEPPSSGMTFSTEVSEEDLEQIGEQATAHLLEIRGELRHRWLTGEISAAEVEQELRRAGAE